MKKRTHTHPKAGFNRIIQYGAMIVVILLAIAALLMVIIALGDAPDGFILIAFVTILLAFPLMMLTTIAPAVTVAEDGMTLHPVVWKELTIGWQEITHIAEFPLLPSEDAEVMRKITVGRIKYRPAQGIMLVIPTLPVQYRIAGFFAGTGGKPITALTNRAHTDYDQLMKTILQHTDSAMHDEDLIDAG